MAYVIACEYLLSFLLRQKRTDQDVIFHSPTSVCALAHTRMSRARACVYASDTHDRKVWRWSGKVAIYLARFPSHSNVRTNASSTPVWQFLVAICDCIHTNTLCAARLSRSLYLPLLPGCHRCPYACCTYIAVTPLTTTKKWNIFIMQSRNNKWERHIKTKICAANIRIRMRARATWVLSLIHLSRTFNESQVAVRSGSKHFWYVHRLDYDLN